MQPGLTRRYLQAELDAEKKKRADDLEALKKHYEEEDQKRRENRTERLQREKLFHVARRADKMKTTPQNRAKIEEQIGTIDLLGIGIRKGTRINLSELREAINEQKAKDPDWEISPRVEAMLTRLDNKQISEMDIHDVSNLTDILLNLDNEIRTPNKTIATQDKRNVYAQAEAAAASVRQAKAPMNSTSKKNGYLSLMLSPERFVRRLVGYDESSSLYTLTKDLSDGQRKAQRFEMESERCFDKWHSNKKFMESLTGKKPNGLKFTA